MTKETRRRMYDAYTTAAELIRGAIEVGWFPEDVGEIDESGLEEVVKAYNRVHDKLLKLADKYKPSKKD